MKTISQFNVHDMTVQYVSDATGRVGLRLWPASLDAQRVDRRSGQPGQPPIDPLVHVKVVGDPYPGAFAQGHTMRDSPGIARFKFVEQARDEAAGRTTVRTTLRDEAGVELQHDLSWSAEDRAATIISRVINCSSKAVTLEMLTSFSLGGLTPFAADDAAGRLQVHRFRSVWSAEGRLETQSIEQLHLEPSWGLAGLYSERFGQVGTMPVRRWFPFVALQDTVANVTWGAQLAWAGSWQMEIARQHDDVCLSGGLADREFGHWMKTLAPGESIESPPATLTCVAGGLDELCDRLTAAQQAAADRHPNVEQTLPIIFNEWCTTWGDPAHEKVVKIADTLAGSPAKYLVIDAGWYKSEGTSWDRGHGDWVPSKTLFPDGLQATANAIRKRGLIPGLWFEMETVGDSSAAFSLVDHLLQRDGIPVTVRHRRFWNLNDPFAVDYLTEKVIDLLQQCGFGYLKVDYNETAGVGFDDRDSLGEGQRKQILASYRFFDRIRERLPDLVIENCASGGHRLEPSMLGKTAMSSFSDAHESVEIPIIAANLHRLMLPRQSQIWAVLKKADSDQRLIYSLAATFLGRMCLSGEFAELSAPQRGIVDAAMALYGSAAPIIKHGTSCRVGELGPSWRHPAGWQSVVRYSVDERQALIVTHTFADAPAEAQINLLTGTRWNIEQSFASGSGATIGREGLLLSGLAPFAGRVDLLRRV